MVSVTTGKTYRSTSWEWEGPQSVVPFADYAPLIVKEDTSIGYTCSNEDTFTLVDIFRPVSKQIADILSKFYAMKPTKLSNFHSLHAVPALHIDAA